MRNEMPIAEPDIAFETDRAELPKPQPGPQEKALRATFVNEMLWGGARGGGKSVWILLDFAQGVKEHGKNWRGIIFRRTYPELDEILNESRRIFYKAFPGCEYKVGQRKWFFPNGAELSLRHLENEASADSYQGHQYTWIGFDEIQQWENLNAYHKLKATLRSGAAEVPNKRIRCTGNPGGIGHQEIKSYFIDNAPEGTVYHDPKDNSTRMFIKSLVTDNKILLKRDPNYIDRLKGVGDDLLVKAWLEGDWDSFVGQYFSRWKEDEIVVPSFKIPSHWSLWAGLDYGESSYTAFGLFTQDHEKNIYQIMEFYKRGATASTYAQDINQMVDSCPFTDGRRPTAIYADPSMFTKRRLTEVIQTSPADVFTDHHLYLQRANNDRVTGWRILNDALANKKFYVFDQWNDNTLRTVPALPRCKRNPEDLDTHAEDHLADMIRYALIHQYRPAPLAEPVNRDPQLGQNVIDSILDNQTVEYGRYS